MWLSKLWWWWCLQMALQVQPVFWDKIQDVNKLMLWTYYLDWRALYWHQNFWRSIRNQGVTWNWYIETLYYKFEGQKDPLEKLKDLKQEDDLKAYIQDFDMWNWDEINKKQAFGFLPGRVRIRD